MELNRRNVIRSTAVIPAAAVIGMAGGQLATCSNGQVVLNPVILDTIMKAVAEGCNFIPAVETIVALAGTTFPALVGAATISEAVLAEIKDILCANIPTPANPITSLKMKAGPSIAVEAHGWIIGPNGKLVYV